MEDAERQSVLETIGEYEDKVQEQYNRAEHYKHLLNKERKENKKLKRIINRKKQQDKQHFRNQTGGKKGVRR